MSLIDRMQTRRDILCSGPSPRRLLCWTGSACSTLAHPSTCESGEPGSLGPDGGKGGVARREPLSGNTGRDMDPANPLTKWHWIVELARKKPGTVLFSLNHVIDFEWMREAYIRTRKDGATGIDGVTAQEYEANLEANLKDPRRQTARRNRSTFSASPPRGESRGRARTWCGKRRPKVDLPARWLRSRNGAGPTGIGLHANSTPGCLR